MANEKKDITKSERKRANKKEEGRRNINHTVFKGTDSY